MYKDILCQDSKPTYTMGGGFMQVIPMGASMWAGKSIQPYPSTSSADAGRASDMCMEHSRAIYQPLKKTFTSV